MKTIVFCGAAVAMCAGLTAHAATCNWTGKGSDTLWSTAGNWNALPTASDNLGFRQANVGSRTATLDGLYTYNGNLHLGLGSSAAAPYVFEATAPGHG